MEPEKYIEQLIGELSDALRGRADSSRLLRLLSDGIALRLLEDTPTDHIGAPNAVVEIVDSETGRLYRRYLELGYEENDNGIRIVGENMSGEPTSLIFLSESALMKMRDLQGGGSDSPRCKD